MQTIGERSKTLELYDPAARVTTVGTYGSKVIDRTGFDSCVGILNSAASSAGTSVSLNVKMQESDALARGYDNSTGAESTDNALRDATNSNIKFAAKFTQSGARQIAKVFLRLKKVGTITSGKKVTVTIETDSTGDPSGTAVHADATKDVQTDDIAAAYGWVEFAFPRAVDLADATVYHIVLTGDYDVSGSNYIALADTTVASGGNFNYYDSAWGTLSTTKKVVGYVEEYNFTDISGYTFTQVDENAASHEAKEWSLVGKKANVRAKATVAGTSASFICGASIVLGQGKTMPVA